MRLQNTGLGLLTVAAAACNKTQPNPRVGFYAPEIAVPFITVTLGAKTWALKDATYVDLQPNETAESAIPELTIATPCGPKKLTVQRTPPNGNNVTTISVEWADLPKPTDIVLDPNLTGPIALGVIVLPSPMPKSYTVFDFGCGKPVSVAGVELVVTPEVAASPAILIAAAPGACFHRGEVLYGSTTTATKCRAPSEATLTGGQLYPLGLMPSLLWKSPTATRGVKGSCTNMSYLITCETVLETL